MRIVFMGTPEFASRALSALIAAPGLEVVAVVSQPDRKAGRGKKLTPPPVAALARKHELPLNQVETCRTAAFRHWVASFDPDIAVVAAFGHILGPKALAVPRLGCLNIHASLLPRWRGAAPIQASILAGDSETGVTIMQMDRGLDTGPMLCERRTPISSDDTTPDLHDRLAALGAEAIVATLTTLSRGDHRLDAVPQPSEGATYAEKLAKSDGVIDWARPATDIQRQIRALHPWPGTVTTIGGKPLKLLPPVSVIDTGETDTAPGEVIEASADGLTVACGRDAVRIGTLQAQGQRAMDAQAYLAGHKIAVGTVVGDT